MDADHRCLDVNVTRWDVPSFILNLSLIPGGQLFSFDLVSWMVDFGNHRVNNMVADEKLWFPKHVHPSFVRTLPCGKVERVVTNVAAYLNTSSCHPNGYAVRHNAIATSETTPHITRYPLICAGGHGRHSQRTGKKVRQRRQSASPALGEPKCGFRMNVYYDAKEGCMFVRKHSSPKLMHTGHTMIPPEVMTTNASNLPRTALQLAKTLIEKHVSASLLNIILHAQGVRQLSNNSLKHLRHTVLNKKLDKLDPGSKADRLVQLLEETPGCRYCVLTGSIDQARDLVTVYKRFHSEMKADLRETSETIEKPPDLKPKGGDETAPLCGDEGDADVDLSFAPAEPTSPDPAGGHNGNGEKQALSLLPDQTSNALLLPAEDDELIEEDPKNDAYRYVESVVKALTLKDGEVLLAVVFATREGILAQRRYPYVWGVDVTWGTNNEKRPHARITTKSTLQNALPLADAFLPSQQGYAFGFLFNDAIPFIFDPFSLKLAEICLSDECRIMVPVLRSAMVVHRLFGEALSRLCKWHKVSCCRIRSDVLFRMKQFS